MFLFIWKSITDPSSWIRNEPNIISHPPRRILPPRIPPRRILPPRIPPNNHQRNQKHQPRNEPNIPRKTTSFRISCLMMPLWHRRLWDTTVVAAVGRGHQHHQVVSALERSHRQLVAAVGRSHHQADRVAPTAAIDWGAGAVIERGWAGISHGARAGTAKSPGALVGTAKSPGAPVGTAKSPGVSVVTDHLELKPLRRVLSLEIAQKQGLTLEMRRGGVKPILPTMQQRLWKVTEVVRLGIVATLVMWRHRAMAERRPRPWSQNDASHLVWSSRCQSPEAAGMMERVKGLMGRVRNPKFCHEGRGLVPGKKLIKSRMWRKELTNKQMTTTKL